MKVNTIEKIHKILINNEEATYSAYREFKEKLREKYGTIWIKNEITKEEAEKLEKREKEMHEASNLLEEFEQNEWQQK